MTSLETVVRKRHPGPGTVLAGTSYPDLVALVERMQAQDPRLIFDSLRPMGDEFWNMIDGQRAIAEIAESVCLQFGFDLPPDLFLPLVDNMLTTDAVEVVKQG
jgi:hypothetical protein